MATAMDAACLGACLMAGDGRMGDVCGPPGAGSASGGNRDCFVSRLCLPSSPQAAACVCSRLNHAVASVCATADVRDPTSLAEGADAGGSRIHLRRRARAVVAWLPHVPSAAGELAAG